MLYSPALNEADLRLLLDSHIPPEPEAEEMWSFGGSRHSDFTKDSGLGEVPTTDSPALHSLPSRLPCAIQESVVALNFCTASRTPSYMYSHADGAALQHTHVQKRTCVMHILTRRAHPARSTGQVSLYLVVNTMHLGSLAFVSIRVGEPSCLVQKVFGWHLLV
ncbi:hypothetical protein BCR44DRAFT_1148238 [Catenaria anguillulae PL171]|uniref:Uncharacterized protein n=1 Tax=Catenaria anguillulae PL171 TaxID=765915 RepID=A0A1Y2HJ02_9FUNG|nr:hypothetical protein BCR44DRAFT_1148238 [Catenaria anguillulae PL171]